MAIWVPQAFILSVCYDYDYARGMPGRGGNGDDTMGGHNASLSKHLRVGYVAHGTMAKEYDDKCAVAKHAHDEDEREENDDEIRLGAIHWTHVVLLLGGIVHGCDGCC